MRQHLSIIAWGTPSVSNREDLLGSDSLFFTQTRDNPFLGYTGREQVHTMPGRHQAHADAAQRRQHGFEQISELPSKDLRFPLQRKLRMGSVDGQPLPNSLMLFE